MHNISIQKKNNSGMAMKIILVISAIAGISMFSLGYFDMNKKDGSIVVDMDNTEIVVEKKDLKEIELRLGELDIDLDDILGELEF